MSGTDRQTLSVFDDAIRPQLLRELVAARLPSDGKQAQISPGAVAALASAVHDHHLLHDQAVSGQSAVDAWEVVLKRFSAGESAENHWALAAVTGVACYQSSWRSFATSFATWLNNLLPLLKPTEPAFVRQAACKAAVQLLQRLASLQDMPGIRREGNAAVGKLVPALLQLLREDNKAGGVTHDALLLLQAAIDAQPGAWKWHVSALESLLVQELAGTHSRPMAALCGELLARLPQISGDSGAWSACSRKTLVTCNALLDVAFAGLEDPVQSAYAASTLNPAGVEPAEPWIEPPQVLSADFEQHFLLQFTAFASSLRQLLTSPYPNAVPVAVGPTLALAARALAIDGQRPSTARIAPTSTQRLVAVGFSTLMSPSLAPYAIEDLNTLSDMKQSVIPPIIQQTGKKRKKGKSGNPQYDQKAAIVNAEELADFAQDGVLGVVTPTTDSGGSALAALQLRTSRNSGVPGMQEVCTNALLACEALLHPHSPALAPLHADSAASAHGRSDPWKDVELSLQPHAERVQEALSSPSRGSEHQANNTLAVYPHEESRPSSPAQQLQLRGAAAETSRNQQDATVPAKHAQAPGAENAAADRVLRQAAEAQPPQVNSRTTAATARALPEPALLSTQQPSHCESLLQPMRPAAAKFNESDEDSEGPMPAIVMAPPDDEEDDEMTS
eukprot:jgi/Chlat1/2240/Chrsp17S08724